jgi:hypothetical protein
VQLPPVLGHDALLTQFALLHIVQVACFAFLTGTCGVANTEAAANKTTAMLKLIFFIMIF